MMRGRVGEREIREKSLGIEWYSRGFWLLVIAGLLIAFNLCLVEYSSVYLLFWFVALSITWKQRNKLDFNSDLFSTAIALSLITYLLFRGVVVNNDTDVITRMYPLLSVLGIYLLASKASKLGQYKRELIIVSLTAIPWEHIFSLLSPVDKISILDAKVSRLMLWYVGFDVSQTENLVILPTGAIQIAGACSSFNLLGLLWQSCLVMCLYFVLKRSQKVWLWICSTAIALVVNGMRLCLMALLVANDRQSAFDYWHGSAGAEIFTTVAILLLAVVYWYAFSNKQEAT